MLRGVIDKRREQKGRFIITGSSSPELLNNISESLAGRIAIIYVSTLKSNEIFERPLPSWYKIFEDEINSDAFANLQPELTKPDMRSVWFKGGYPEPVLADDDFFYQQWMQNYFATYINRDIAALFPRLNRQAYQNLIHMLAELSGTIVNKSELGRSLSCNESTARDYLRIAEQTFIWRELPSYEGSKEKSIVKKPKGHLRDRGLCHYLQTIHKADKLLHHPSLGASFESFVIEEILKGLEAGFAVNSNAYYYRTRAGAEIDLILEGPFGTLPIEIKYGASVRPRQLQSLTQFIERYDLPMGLLINQAEDKLWLSDKILQLPVEYL